MAGRSPATSVAGSQSACAPAFPARALGACQGFGRFAERLAFSDSSPRRVAPKATSRPGAAIAPEPGEGKCLEMLFGKSATDIARPLLAGHIGSSLT